MLVWCWCLLAATSRRYAAERGATAGLQFQHIVGVVLQEDKQALERMIFRISRGNCYVRFSNIDEPLQNEKGAAVHKVVFIIFYRSASLTPKLRRICDAFAANRHEIPEFESRDKVGLGSPCDATTGASLLWEWMWWRGCQRLAAV